VKTNDYLDKKLRLLYVKLALQVVGVAAEAAIAIALWVWLRGGI
jgi:hypothetical protein